MYKLVSSALIFKEEDVGGTSDQLVLNVPFCILKNKTNSASKRAYHNCQMIIGFMAWQMGFFAILRIETVHFPREKQNLPRSSAWLIPRLCHMKGPKEVRNI